MCRGYNIGIRLIDEFLAKSKTGKCIDFRDTADKIAKVLRSTHILFSLHCACVSTANYFQPATLSETRL